MRFVIVAHTHWDREWYEPFAVFQRRLVELFDGLLELLPREPAFRHFHLDGQSAMIDDYLALRPEREPELRALFHAGRLSIGPWFTQMDEFLTSGESTIRNLEWGLARARSFGIESPVGGPWAGYLPDQFGHIGQMPQLLRRAGIDRAVLWRGVPSAIDRASFTWRSPDGSEVLAEYYAYGYELGAGIRDRLASAGDLGAELERIAAVVAPMADRPMAIIPVGGDHSVPMAPMATLLAAARELTGLDIGIGSIAEFLGQAPPPVDPPTWAGELRAAARPPLLPNVYSARPHQKRRRARLEARLERYAEPLTALVHEPDGAATALTEVWRRLLWNGAHDSVCGCSHDQVARDVDARFQEAEELVEEVIAGAATRLAARSSVAGMLRWNPSPFEREGIPGLGWTVLPAEASLARPHPVELTVGDGRVVLDDGTTISFTDEDDVGDLYDFCPPEDGAPMPPLVVERLGPGRAVARFAGSSIEISATRRAGEPFVRLDGRIENARPDHRLRLWIRLPSAPDGSTALSPFEIVDRPLVGEGGPEEIGSSAWPARGAVLAAGTAVLAEGVIEYEVAGDRLGIALLRAIGLISRPTIPTRPMEAGPDTPTPEAQCIGETRFALGIRRDARRETLVEDWERFALPLLEVPAPGGGAEVGGPLLEVDGGHLSAIRRVVGGVEVRIWNDSAERRSARVAGLAVPLGPARIETLRLEGPAR
ncbi:MAG: hypothetical protein RL338_1738 [Chloroflexota bacterium]|jgi:alpha-mannosidase